jgi:hypothetical protein
LQAHVHRFHGPEKYSINVEETRIQGPTEGYVVENESSMAVYYARTVSGERNGVTWIKINARTKTPAMQGLTEDVKGAK